MKTSKHKSTERGFANYEWLQAKYSFNFSNYFDPFKNNFGALRVLNDDIIQGGKGFGNHPHDNMEIITIPLKGSLKHKDSMSNQWVSLHTGEVQVMSAGTGIFHSERNNSETEPINLFQIWIIPNKQNVEPFYTQKKFDTRDRINKLQTLVSSHTDLDENSLKIHQDARISRVDLSGNNKFIYNLKSIDHCVYVMLISGEMSINNEILKPRDALGIEETTNVSLLSNKNSEVLFIEIPKIF